KDVSGLVSPPDICMRVFELLQSPDSSGQDIGNVIIQDPNLTARLLKVVNSPFYNFSQRIDTVTRAITIVGVRDLYNLVIAISAVRSFSNIASDLVNMDTFWRHSMFTALIARGFAKRCHILHPERLFIAGLLHDIGSLVIYNRLPEVARDIILVADGDENALYEAETRELGFGHPELGALLLELWNIPKPLQNAVRHHHRPSQADPADAPEAAIIHLAESLANRSEIGGFCEESRPSSPEPATWDILEVDPETLDFDQILGDAAIEFTDTAGLLISG
ncbi:MAG: HD-like signal output (HDOD) protein, partial [Gammaproteobacteria bacterium]